MLTVVEVIDRSKEGRTEPYICRCDDGDVYFVKGQSATRRGLINEWLCGHLATAMGIPIAPFDIAVVPEELMEADDTGWLRDLGAGAAFASQRVIAQDLSAAHVAAVAEPLRRDVLVFDWWVHNNDRHLTVQGGNVNLLWAPAAHRSKAADDEDDASGRLVVIDHNLALDPDFSAEDFCQTHVFAADLPATFSDFELREAYRLRLGKAVAALQTGG